MYQSQYIHVYHNFLKYWQVICKPELSLVTYLELSVIYPFFPFPRKNGYDFPLLEFPPEKMTIQFSVSRIPPPPLENSLFLTHTPPPIVEFPLVKIAKGNATLYTVFPELWPFELGILNFSARYLVKYLS